MSKLSHWIVMATLAIVTVFIFLSFRASEIGYLKPLMMIDNGSLQISNATDEGDHKSVWVRADVIVGKPGTIKVLSSTVYSRVDIDCNMLTLAVQEQRKYDSNMKYISTTKAHAKMRSPTNMEEMLIVMDSCNIKVKVSVSKPDLDVI